MKRSFINYFAIILVVVLFDQISKYLIMSTFELHETKEIVPGLFNLLYITNKGAAFSFLANVTSSWRHWFFLIIGSAAIIGISCLWYQSGRNNFILTASYAMIVGGAAGNLIDRVAFGAVVDFLDFYFRTHHWPTFNVADSAICVGAGLFVLESFLEIKRENNRSSI